MNAIPPTRTDDTLHFSLVSDGVGLIELRRAEKRNAMSSQMRAALDALLISRDVADLRAVVIAGAGPHFCAGADIRERSVGATRVGIDLLARIRDAPPVIVCAAQGYTLGLGAGILLASDLAVVGESLRLALPETALGHVPAMLIPEILRVLPRPRATDLLMTGRSLSAEEVVGWGLARSFVPDLVLREAAIDLATMLSAMPADAARRTKLLANESSDLAYPDAVDRCAVFATSVDASAAD